MANQIISKLQEVLGCPVKKYEEGMVSFFAPVSKEIVSASDVVFYNPRMEFSRDVSICLVQTYQRITGKEMDLCEPLTSCGVRVVRWACEVPGVRSISAGDINPRAAFLANVNANFNGVLDKVQVFRTDANLLLDTYSSRGRRFDVVDIDPFGSPVYFIDPALKALKREGGLLCLTATDMQPLCGIHQDACLRKYGGASLRTEYCHEIAIRLLVGAAVRIAVEHDLGVRVVFSHSSDHYIRAYLLTRRNAIEADVSTKKMGFIIHCFECGNRRVVSKLTAFSEEPKCELCGSSMRLAGPLWCGELWDKQFVDTATIVAAETKHGVNRRLAKMLALISSECSGPPTYYDLHSISDLEGISSPPTSKIIERLRSNGFFASATHFKGTCVRTTAGIEEIRSVIKQLV
jgi:tRNA (guanine26-N2/guanine27-N2)-dimethyltransferase